MIYSVMSLPMTLSDFTIRECDVVLFSFASVSMFVCPVRALTFDRLDLQDGSKSKLLVLSEYVNITEKIGGT